MWSSKHVAASCVLCCPGSGLWGDSSEGPKDRTPSRGGHGVAPTPASGGAEPAGRACTAATEFPCCLFLNFFTESSAQGGFLQSNVLTFCSSFDPVSLNIWCSD